MKHIPELDGLRGIAVLIVLLSHTSGRGQAITPYLEFHGIGRVGVYLFFSLSAFLLTYPFLGTKFSKVEIKVFFIKRFFRIAPLYYIFVLGIYLYQKLSGNFLHTYLYLKGNLVSVWQHLLFYRGDGVFWTIPVEVQFYMIAPILIYFLLRYLDVAAIAIMSIGLLHASIYYLSKLSAYKHLSLILFATKYEARSTFIEVFIFSMLAAYCVRRYNNQISQYKNKINYIATLGFYGILTISILLCSNRFIWLSKPFYNFREITLIYAITFSIVLISLFIGNSHLSKILSHWSLIWVGKLGFSIYLSHMGIIYIVNLTNLPSPIKFCLTMIFCLSLSWVTFQFIEKPFVQFGKRVIRKQWLT